MSYGKTFYEKKREKREIKIRKMFSPFQIRKTFYRKMALFSIDHPKQTGPKFNKS